MTRDEIWEALKRDKTTVYGEPIMDMFLKSAEWIAGRHIRSLDERRLKLVDPDTRLWEAEGVEEAAAAIKAGAKDLRGGVYMAAKRGDTDVIDLILSLDDAPILLTSALEGACRYGTIELVRELLGRTKEKGVDMSRDLQNTIFYAAASGGRSEAFEYLHDEGYGEWESPEEMMTLAIRAGSIRIAKDNVGKIDDDALAELADFAHRKGRREIASMIERELEYE